MTLPPTSTAGLLIGQWPMLRNVVGRISPRRLGSGISGAHRGVASSLMNLNALHRRLLQDVLEIGNAFPFVITGGYAVQAHGLVDRWSRDIDVATNSPVPMAALAEHWLPGSRNVDGRYESSE